MGTVEFWKKTKGREREGGKGEGRSWWYMDEVGGEIIKVESPEDVKRRVREHTLELVEGALARGQAREVKR